MKRIINISFLLIITIPVFCQNQSKMQEFSNYQEMRDYFGKLYEQEKYEEAAALMEKGLLDFPDHTEANAFNLAFIYVKLEQFDKSMDALQYGLDHGVWFSIYAFLSDVWNPCRELEKFQKILDRNEELRQEAQKLAKPELVIVTPEKFEKSKKYPLFIALHGGNSNIVNFREAWKSEKLKKEFITAYVQSSQIVAMNGFSWTEDIEIAKKEISEAYHKVLAEHSIKKNEVIIGGFSSGSVAAMEITFSNTIPVRGFISLCPGKPESFTEENIINAKRRGIRGTILTNEMDRRLEVQKEMVELLKTTGFKYCFEVTPNIGHWFPDDLDLKIDKAIDHIRNR